MKLKQFALVWPEAWSTLVTQCLLVMLVAAVAVLAVDWARKFFRDDADAELRAVSPSSLAEKGDTMRK